MFACLAAVEGLVRIRVTRADEHTPLPQPGSILPRPAGPLATTLQDGHYAGRAT
jgi:hypothetical protein